MLDQLISLPPEVPLVGRSLAPHAALGRAQPRHRVQIFTHPFRLVIKRHVRRVVYAVQGTLRVLIESGEQSIEILLCQTFDGDEFEGLAQRVIRDEAADQNLRDLAARYDTIAGVPCLTCIALQQDEPVLVGAVVIEPAGAHDCVRQSAGAHQSLGAPLPIMSFSGLVVFAGAVCDSDGGHQRDAHFPRTQGAEDIANTSVIDVLGGHLSATVRAKGKNDGIDTVYRASQRFGLGNITYGHLRFGRKLAGFIGCAHKSTHGVALTDCFLDNEPSDATRSTNDQHSHVGNGHAHSSLFAGRDFSYALGVPARALPCASRASVLILSLLRAYLNTTSCRARAKIVPSLPPINREPRMPTRILPSMPY